MSKRRRPGRKKQKARTVILLIELIVVVILGFIVYKTFKPIDYVKYAEMVEIPEWIDVQLIDEGNPSRNGLLLDGINDIVIHYVGNPGTTAQQNRDFFNHEDSDVCSHFVVGMEGEIIMCLPLNERSAASNDRNHDTISIEVSHPDDTGKFTDASYESLLKLTRWLMKEFGLKKNHVIRHYDVTGKECPRYFVTHEDAWEKFREDL
ncbi:N-acetylmuramoyl-L-alanine amidase family protein [Butyrivibrio sp. INlla16]|uniref:peptidoglycan recognition protein family protein n=1 Tax=Butyrivibrio sp. INlla16 TaxID=1520807 RepID=UPI0008832967|nr:peptidoglycan recognition family protein [Butyrivibrio sp. INlla16]SDB14958.1 N-acetylmuramoyl-L-alanine amidase [Butyrivibrio sp. INlla16]